MDYKMFCYQCQETAGGKGCTIRGVCGKEPTTSGLMDLLIYALRGIAIVNRELRRTGATRQGGKPTDMRQSFRHYHKCEFRQ